MSKEAMKLALEALEYIHEGANNQGPHTGISWRCVSNKAESAITALREALTEQPAQQKPVAHCEAGPEFCPVCHAETRSLALAAAIGYIQRNTPPLVSNEICNALKKSPPAQRTWVGLTDEEIKLVMDGCGEEGDDDYVKPAFDPFGISEDDLMNFARAIEAKLKEKNNG